MDTLKAEPLDTATDNPTPNAPKPKRRGRVKRFLLRTLAVLVTIAVLAQLIYTLSGSEEWEKLGTKNGVTVYSMKSTGSNLKKFKGEWKVRATLGEFVMFAQDSDADLKLGYWGVREIERTNQQVVWNTWKMNFPRPFKPRQFVIKNEFVQDPKTKELTYTVMATPDKIPPDDCCVRVETMNNIWKVTPLKNGELAVEWMLDMDTGLPYFMVNPIQPRMIYRLGPKLQTWLDNKKYDNARYDWIQEAQP
jgi:hypothetical protein